MVMAGRVAVGHGGRMAVAAPADMVGSINNSEADGGDGPDLDDHLRGVRAHVAPNIDPRHQRHRYINELRNHAMRQARQAQADFREYQRQQALAEGRVWNSDDEEGTCDLRPDFLAMSEPVARAVYPRYDAAMQDIYQVSFLGFNLSADNNRQRSLYTILCIWNTMMGTSVLAMPWAFMEAGLAGAIVLCIINGPLAAFTAIMIDVIHKKANEGRDTPLGEFVHLCDHYCGKALKFLVNIGSAGAVTGAAIVYLILISGLQSDIGNVAYHGLDRNITWESITNVTCAAHPDLLDAEEADNSIVGIMLRKKVLLFVNAVLFFLPFTFVSASTFRKVNAIGSVCNVLLVFIVLIFAFSWGLNLDFYNTDAEFYMPLVQPRFYRLTGVLSMGLFLHNAVITIVSATEDQKNNQRDIAIGYSLVTGTYIIVGLAFYLTFPLAKKCISESFLDNFPHDNPIMIGMRGLLLIQLSTIYPIIAMIWRDSTSNVVNFNNPDVSVLYKGVYNFILLGACAILGVILPNIGAVITIFGSICGFMLIYFAPSLVAWTVMRKERADAADPDLTRYPPPPISRTRFYAMSLFYVFITVFGALNLFANLYDFSMRFEADSDDDSSTALDMLQINPRFYLYTS